jgi:hypothetical protein
MRKVMGRPTSNFFNIQSRGKTEDFSIKIPQIVNTLTVQSISTTNNYLQIDSGRLLKDDENLGNVSNFSAASRWGIFIRKIQRLFNCSTDFYKLYTDRFSSRSERWWKPKKFQFQAREQLGTFKQKISRVEKLIIDQSRFSRTLYRSTQPDKRKMMGTSKTVWYSIQGNNHGIFTEKYPNNNNLTARLIFKTNILDKWNMMKTSHATIKKCLMPNRSKSRSDSFWSIESMNLNCFVPFQHISTRITIWNPNFQVFIHFEHETVETL